MFQNRKEILFVVKLTGAHRAKTATKLKIITAKLTKRSDTTVYLKSFVIVRANKRNASNPQVIDEETFLRIRKTGEEK